MISSECSFRDFMEEIKDLDPLEIVNLANQEATEAERMMLRRAVDNHPKGTCGRRYAESLKGLIYYVRYGVRPAWIENEDFKLCQGIEEKTAPRFFRIRRVS